MENNLTFLIVLGAGLLSFFSPCMLPIIPGYLSYISGVGINEVNSNNGKRWRVFLNTVFFVAGFSVMFILMQIVAISFANEASKIIGSRLIYQIAGSIVMFLGLNMTGIISLKFLMKEKRVKLNLKPGNYIISFVLGFIFGVGWSPCMGPILYSVIAYIAKDSTLKEGIFYMIIYNVGLAVPFLVTGIFIDKASILLKKSSKHFRAIEISAGIILIIMGAMLFSNKLSTIASLFGR